MRTNRTRLLGLALSAGLVGGAFQLGGCSFRDVNHFVGNINPCGTIIACDPTSYTFLTSGYQGPGVAPDIDPACTYPPYCDPNSDPFAP